MPWLALLLALAVAAPASAAVELVESCTDTVEAAWVTWDCEFQDTTYTAGDVATFTINWECTQDASFSAFTLRGNQFTPRGKVKVAGSDPVVVSLNDGATGSVEISLVVMDLHQAGKKGNAHFSLMLYIDEDGDGVLEEKAVQFGVNLHVTDPEEAQALSGGLRLTGEKPIESVSWGSIKSRFSDQ